MRENFGVMPFGTCSNCPVSAQSVSDECSFIWRKAPGLAPFFRLKEVPVDIAFPMSPNAAEAHLNADAKVIGWLDVLFPVEAPVKGNGMFSSDCCGSNNYPE